MPSDPDAIAHDAMNAVAGVQGRLQLLCRRAQAGNRDAERTLFELDLALQCLRRLPPLIEALKQAAGDALVDGASSTGGRPIVSE